MGKVLLPYVEPMYSTYNFLACAGIPAKQNKTSDNWYYNNTVEWRCTRKFLQGFTTPELTLENGELGHIPFLLKSGINTRFARRCAVEIIKTMLDDGYYVAFHGVDDYYIQGKSWYMEQHYNHDGLLIGYDDEKKTFSIAAYNQRWIFTVFETPQDCFVEGMTALCNKGIYSDVYAVKARNDVQELNLNQIYRSLKKYISSDIDKFPLDNPENVSGMAVYDYICMYLDKLTDGSIPHERRDRRIFRFIWEHKKCMFGRISAVEVQCGFDNKISSAYEEVVNLSDKARFIYSKFVIKYSTKNLEKIQIILSQMRNLEYELLTKFLQQIDGNNMLVI